MADKKIEPKRPEKDEPAAGARKAERTTAGGKRVVAGGKRVVAGGKRVVASKKTFK